MSEELKSKSVTPFFFDPNPQSATPNVPSSLSASSNDNLMTLKKREEGRLTKDMIICDAET